MTALDLRALRPANDRRTQRTRAAILQAFSQMVLEVGFDAITPSTLAAAANVGRSTFYEHFSNLDEVLAFSIGRLLKPLAQSAMKPKLDPAVVPLIQHFWDNRKIARAMLSGGGRNVVHRLLADQFETELITLRADLDVTAPATAPKLAAAHLSAGMLALLSTWLSGHASGTALQITEALHAAAYASACAFSVQAQPLRTAI